jgi:hypothetical protein
MVDSEAKKKVEISHEFGFATTTYTLMQPGKEPADGNRPKKKDQRLLVSPFIKTGVQLLSLAFPVLEAIRDVTISIFSFLDLYQSL